MSARKKIYARSSEYTPGIESGSERILAPETSRDEASLRYAPVFERMGVTFIWGEVKEVRSGSSAADRCVRRSVFLGLRSLPAAYEFVVISSPDGFSVGWFFRADISEATEMSRKRARESGGGQRRAQPQ